MNRLFQKATPKKQQTPPVSSLRVFDGFVSPVLILDRRMTIKGMNQAAGRLTDGVGGDSVLGKSLRDLQPRALWRPIAEQARVALTGEHAVTCEGVNATTGTIWEFTINRLAEDLGDEHLVVTAREVSEVKRAEQQQQRQSQYVAALHEITAGLMNRLDGAALLEGIVRQASALLGVGDGFVYLVEPDGERMRLQTGVGVLAAVANVTVQPFEGLSGKVWQTAQPLVVNDYQNWNDRLQDERLRVVQAAMGLPLLADGAVLGVFGVATTQAGRAFEEDEIETLQRFANLVCIVLDNTRMYRTLQQESLERKRAEESQRDSSEKYKLLFQRNPLPLLVYDRETLAVISVNEAAVRHYGYARDEFLRLKFSDLRYTGNTSALLFELAQSAPSLTNDTTWKHRKKDGTVIDVEVTSHEIAFGGKRAILALVNDVTERKRAEVILQKREEHYRSLIENASDLILILNAHGTMSYASPSVERALGYDGDELLCRNVFEFVHPEDFSQTFAALTRMVEHPEASQASELRLRHKQGAWRLYEAMGRGVLDENGTASVIINARDITERKAAEEQLAYNAFHDPLTNLPNRRLFMDRLGQAIKHAKRRPTDLYAVLFLDFDHFKLVNDSLGHIIGDELLVAIAKRLEANLRGEDTFARLGGDEFAILLENLDSPEVVLHVADRIQACLAEPFILNEQTLYVTVSIGIALSTTNYDKPEDILRDADTAMYGAKGRGKSCHVVFDDAMHTQAVQLLEFRNDLRRAIERDEFVLYYQPIMRLATTEVVGFEALIRWQHPKFGLVAPARFIPLAEEMGLINVLGEWVLHEACRQTREWDERHPQRPQMFISVNLSVKELAQPRLVKKAETILQTTGLEPERLKIEITESLFMEDPETMALVLAELKELGVQLQIDDFGTGYSSLSYLHKFPVDALKVDRSFVHDLNTNIKNAEIIRTVVMLARNLGMTVIAEGIETTEHLTHLQNLECEYGQGFLFSKPVAGRQAESLILSPQEAGAALSYASAAAAGSTGPLACTNTEMNFNGIW